METPEGEKTIYKITKQKMKSQKDIGERVVIKDQSGNILTEADKIRGRWREYFNQLLNIENSRDPLHEVKPVEGPIENIKETEVEKAVERMKKGKATGCSGLSVDLMSSLGEQGLRMMTEMMEAVWREGKIPREWEKSEIVPIYNQKGDPLDCGNYRGIKLLEHMLKVMERVLDQRLRELIEIDNMQFGFRKGRGTTDAIFIVNQLQEKYLEMQKDLFFAFVDLEKAYDRVPREIVYWCLRKRNVPEWLIMLVEAAYTNSRTVVRTAQGQTDPFDIKVGLHQGSALSPFLFIVVMDTISKEFRGRLPWELLFADDLVIIAESKEELQEKWLRWQRGMASQGLKVNTGKTEVLVSSRDRKEVHIVDSSNTRLNQVEQFKYLGVVVNETGGSEEAVGARISAAWNNWREVSRVVGDKKMPRGLKVKIYETIVRPVMTYGAELWVIRKKEERLLETTEMKMLRRIKGVTRRGRELGVEKITSRIRTARLRWYGHVKRMEDGNKVRRTMEMVVEGRRSRGRPKLRWIDNIKKDVELHDLTGLDVFDRAQWRKRVQTPDPAT